MYRYLSTRVISVLYTDPDELLSEAERRLATEPDQHVAAVLINEVARHLHTRPNDVDHIFSRLSSLRGSAHLFDTGQEESGLRNTAAELVVRYLAILAIL